MPRASAHFGRISLLEGIASDAKAITRWAGDSMRQAIEDPIGTLANVATSPFGLITVAMLAGFTGEPGNVFKYLGTMGVLGGVIQNTGR